MMINQVVRRFSGLGRVGQLFRAEVVVEGEWLAPVIAECVAWRAVYPDESMAKHS